MSGRDVQYVVLLQRCKVGLHEGTAHPDACVGWYGEYLLCECPCHDTPAPPVDDSGGEEGGARDVGQVR